VLTDNSEVSRGNLTYLWDFGDGVTTSTYSSSIVSHSYENSGLYSITLYVESDYGCRDSSTVEVGVIKEVVSAFEVNDTIQCFKGNEFMFLSKSTGPQGKLRHFWDFGDSVTAETVSAKHSYAEPGTYNVTLVIGHASGCTDTSSFSVIVYPSPNAKFSVNDSSQTLTGNEFIFTNLTQVSSGELGYIWKFGDTSALSTLVNPRHVYDTTGTYTVTLISTELTTGCSDTSALSMYVFGTVDANFSINDTLQCFEGNEFVFDNLSKINGGEMIFNWDLGDGSKSEEKSPSYTYQTPGLYKVRLLVTGTAGGSDSAIIVVRVSPMPEVFFTINDSIQCLPVNNFNFINKTTIGNDPEPRYLWDLGDSTSSLLKSILGYKYKKQGLYDVKLIATSLYGCQDSITRSVEIGAQTLGIKYDSVVTRKNFETQLEARFYDEAKYLWAPSIYLSQSDTTNPIFYGDKVTQYRIRIIDRYGCMFYDTVKVLFAEKADIYVPNAFTPNVDKLNDKLRPLLINIKEFKYFKIYNRWGIQIYNSTDRKAGWDGTYKGVLQPLDTYTWVAVGVDIDGKTISKSGNFILIK
jgi:gliding motility-associated-like protein